MNKHEQATNQVIEWLELTPQMTYKQVKSTIKKAFTEKYGKAVPKGALKLHIDDFTESVCLKLNINQN